MVFADHCTFTGHLLSYILVFRVPDRTILDHRENVIAPVDGKVVMIKEVEENEFIKGKAIQVSIFMSPLNVHICRYPVSGKVIYKNTIRENILLHGTKSRLQRMKEQRWRWKLQPTIK